MTELYRLIQTNGPGVLIILAILLFGKRMIEYIFSETIEFKKLELNQDLELYKSKLNQESKNFQNLLDIKLNQFNIQFSKLHQDRAEVIKGLYYRLIELQSAMIDFTARGNSVSKNTQKEKLQRAERANNAFKDFINFYMPNKIYFEKELADILDKVSSEYWNKGADFAAMSEELEESKLPRDLYLDNRKRIKEISEIVKNEYPKVIAELENEFREMLGVK